MSDPQTTTAPLAPVPEPWEGGFKLYKYSRDAVKVNLGTLILSGLIVYALIFVLEIALGTLGQVIGEVVSIIGSVAFTKIYLADTTRTKLSVGEALSNPVMLYLEYFGLTIVAGAAVVVSFLLLIIPFFFVAPRLALAPYYMIDQNLGISDSMKASWAAMKGNLKKFYGLTFAGLAMALLCITIIGIPFAIYFLIMYSAATALLYRHVNKHAPAVQAAAPVAS